MKVTTRMRWVAWLLCLLVVSCGPERPPVTYPYATGGTAPFDLVLLGTHNDVLLFEVVCTAFGDNTFVRVETGTMNAVEHTEP